MKTNPVLLAGALMMASCLPVAAQTTPAQRGAQQGAHQQQQQGAHQQGAHQQGSQAATQTAASSASPTAQPSAHRHADHHASLPGAFGRALESNFDAIFMVKAAGGNRFEIEAGRLAAQRSSNRQVRNLATMLVRDHSQAQRDLSHHFRALGMSVPSDPGTMQQATLNRLRSLRGAQFDRAYLAALVESHEGSVTLFQHQAEHGRQPLAVAHARNKLPGIVAHTADIYRIAAAVGAPGITMRPMAVRRAATNAAS